MTLPSESVITRLAAYGVRQGEGSPVSVGQTGPSSTMPRIPELRTVELGVPVPACCSGPQALTIAPTLSRNPTNASAGPARRNLMPSALEAGPSANGASD